MPAAIAEIPSGLAFSRSSQGNQLADTQSRAFRIVLSSPDEFIDVQQTCGVFIGNPYPGSATLTCTSFDARFENSSRMVVLATFNYQSNAGQSQEDPKQQPPEVRPANWTTSSTLSEVPKSTWRQRIGANSWSDEVAAITPAGDMYDGVTALDAVVTISISQWEPTDPTRHLLHAGSVNEETITLGSLTMTPHTVMFRGVTSEPAVEAWGDAVRRGWRCTYEFAYRRNKTKVRIGATAQDTDIGWDIAVPMSGFNCKAFAPDAADADEDVFGQPLKHENGKIKEDDGELFLPDSISAGERVRAMVKVFEYEDGGASQAPSASPIALKANGRPMKTHDEEGVLINPPLVYAYQVQPAINITQTLGLRLN